VADLVADRDLIQGALIDESDERKRLAAEVKKAKSNKDTVKYFEKCDSLANVIEEKNKNIQAAWRQAIKIDSIRIAQINNLEKQRGKIIVTKVIKKTKPKSINKKNSLKIHPKIIEVNTIKTYEENIYSEIVNYLNATAGKNFKPNLRLAQTKIDERLKEGYLLEDFKKVIDIKCKKWLGTKWADYLTPTTLFGDKFGIYLNENINSNKTKTEKTYDTIIKSTELGWNNNKG
jgi:uncharacterized phage protein (TIGR02220 family)